VLTIEKSSNTWKYGMKSYEKASWYWRKSSMKNFSVLCILHFVCLLHGAGSAKVLHTLCSSPPKLTLPAIFRCHWYDVASFLGLQHLQFLITCSMFLHYASSFWSSAVCFCILQAIKYTGGVEGLGTRLGMMAIPVWNSSLWTCELYMCCLGGGL